MRRKDREVIDKSEIIKIIEKCDVCRLGLLDGNVPYIVPMNFGYEYVNDRLTFYFHSAKEGRKLDILREHPTACFEMDCSHKLLEAKLPQNYSMEYESVMGHGKAYFCTSTAEKVKALRLLLNTYMKDRQFDFPDHVVNSVTILKLQVDEFTGKRFKKS